MKKFLSYSVLFVASAFLVTIFTGCEKFPDPGLDQETYRPDSTNQYSANKRRVLLISVDGLSSEALQAINPPAIMALLPNSKYSWTIKPSLLVKSETDVTKSGTLGVMKQTPAGPNTTWSSDKLVDNNFTTKYYTDGFTSGLWYQLTFANPVAIEGYSMTSANDLPDRDPKSWVLLASNNGTNWDTLDSRSNQVFPSRLLTVKYLFENRNAYKTYRVAVIAINAGLLFQQTEWKLIQNEFLPGINSASWGSMMTGNSRTIHRIGDSSFYASPVDTTNAIPVSPNLTALRLLHDYDYGIKSVAISPWNNLVTTLLKDADQKFVTASDAETKNKAVDLLKKDSSRVFITQFGDVFNKRIVNGSNNTAPDFVTAVTKTDGYIKELIDAVKSRSSYNNEEWLVLITSTQGGSGMGAPIDLSSGFLIAYNPLFKQQDLSKMNPVINVQQEDIARQILYWMKVPGGPAIQTGRLWLDRFGVEFIK